METKLRRPTNDEFCKIVKEHEKWLKDPNKGERADFRWMDLTQVEMISADLRYADFSYSDLSHSDLRNSDFSGSVFTCVRLCGTNLSGTKFVGAHMRCASMIRAKLYDTDFHNANLEFVVWKEKTNEELTKDNNIRSLGVP